MPMDDGANALASAPGAMVAWSIGKWRPGEWMDLWMPDLIAHRLQLELYLIPSGCVG